jgi:phosphate transport system substrate-binding protein
MALEATNLQTSEDDNVLVQGVEGSPYAIGYFGFAYYNEQMDKLTAISVAGVAPSFETAESVNTHSPAIVYLLGCDHPEG